MSKRNRLHSARAVALVALSCLLCLSMAGCKPTDFFTEVLISANADQVDETTTNRTIVNSPDADTEDSNLAALDWSKDSLPSEDVESLVVWSSDPNSVLQTHHSVYDLTPRFASIESSDGVRLLFNADSDFEHSVESGGTTSRDDLTEVSPAINANSTNDGAATEGENGTSEGAIANVGQVTKEAGSEESDQEGAGNQGSGQDQNTSGNNANGNTSGLSEGSDTSPDSGDEEGNTIDRFAGLGGNLTIFDPTSSKTRIPHVESLVVIGKQAAVMVQAIGGSGSICAMSNDTYADRGSYAVASFGDVFGDECSSSVIAWASDTAASIQSISLEDFEETLKTWPASTLVVYDQDVTDDPKSLFTDDQLDYMAGYGVQGFWPVDLSSQAGIFNTAALAGETLSESSQLDEGWDSKDMASKYEKALQGLVAAAEKVHGGTFVYNNQERSSNETSIKNSIDYVGSLGTLAGSSTVSLTQAIVATDATTGMSYDGSGLDASRLVLFGGYGMDSYSPLSVWMRAAGVEDVNVQNNYTVFGNKEQNTIFWGTDAINAQGFRNGLSGSSAAYMMWQASGRAYSSMWIEDQGTSQKANGLGSSKTPYLIVCGTSDGSLSSAEVKDLAVRSIMSGDGDPTPYTAFSYSTGGGLPSESYSGLGSKASIGESNSNLAESPFLTGLDANDVVRQNPNGLLGPWIEGNAESVLETLWLTALYTEGPSGSGYSGGAYDWTKFSVTIGEQQISGCDNSSRSEKVREVVSAFYQEFYRYDVDGGVGYNAIIPDEGL